MVRPVDDLRPAALRRRPWPLAVGAAVCLGLVGCVWYLYPQCNDGIRNGGESDVDCGGSCGPCGIGLSCRSGGDCVNGYCVGGTCTPLPCVNGVLDGAETDVDCGGGTCRRCSGGRHCLADADCFSGTCQPAGGTCYALGTVSFTDAGSYAASLKPYVLLTGDFDRDGRADLAVVNEEGSGVTVFLGRGDGTFQRVSPDFATAEYPTGGAVADFNGDGIADIVTADYHGNSVSILLGVGDGTFQARFSSPTVAGAETSNLAVGDLNGDGHLDVIATNPAAGSVSVFLGRGDGTVDPAVTLPVANGLSSPFSVAVGDFDGDGRLDMAIADNRNQSLVLRLGNGDGTFGPEIVLREGGSSPFICIASDVNVDGKLDLVCANRSSSDVSVLLGRGDGTFQDPVVSSTGPGTGPYAVAVADFNLDGVPDLVTPGFQTGTASVLLGIGDGSFEPPIDAGTVGTTSYGVATGDFDGDGRPDFAICNAISGDMAVRLNESF